LAQGILFGASGQLVSCWARQSRMEDGGDADGKSGKELFLEVFRLLPSSQAEDYYINGKWNDVDLQLDYDLLTAHRREAGAEDAPTIEELKEEFNIPELPDNRQGGYVGAIGYQRPMATPPAFQPKVARAALPTPASVTTGITGLRPSPPKSAPTTAMVAAAAGAAGGGGPSAELRQIALFIAKFKLEATKTKLLLARLTPPRRRWVMTNFTQSGTATSPTAAVEQYISQCERTNAWGSSLPGSSLASSAPRPLIGGVKRPFTATGTSMDPNKRAKIGSPASAARPGFAYTAVRPGVTTYAAARNSPAWLTGASAGTVGRIGVAKPAGAPLMRAGGYGSPTGAPLRSTYAGGGYTAARPAGGYAAARPGTPVGITRQPYVAKPAAPKYGGGTIKPAVPKPGGAKPGSLIANLLRM